MTAAARALYLACVYYPVAVANGSTAFSLFGEYVSECLQLHSFSLDQTDGLHIISSHVASSSP
jgi:hypothetical protein